MTHRDRVMKTFRFEQPDRVPYDLMEGCVWPELLEYFQKTKGVSDGPGLLNYLDTDFRWYGLDYVGPAAPPPDEDLPEGWQGSYSDTIMKRPLANATTVAEIEAYFKDMDPAYWQPTTLHSAREAYPEHALVFVPGWMPLFCSACAAFGMEEALVKMSIEPRLFEAFTKRQHEFYMDILARGCKAAKGTFDICWLGDDYASKDAMLMNPDAWRRMIKPYMAEQVRVAHEHGLFVLFHSCGSVRSILPDLIDIGVNALLVFQTTAAGMDAPSIAKEFGGKMAFYGGIDVTRLLTYGTPNEVKEHVRLNFESFRDCGGYTVTNSHHGISNIRGENMEAMYDAARECVY